MQHLKIGKNFLVEKSFTDRKKERKKHDPSSSCSKTNTLHYFAQNLKFNYTQGKIYERIFASILH